MASPFIGQKTPGKPTRQPLYAMIFGCSRWRMCDLSGYFFWYAKFLVPFKSAKLRHSHVKYSYCGQETVKDQVFWWVVPNLLETNTRNVSSLQIVGQHPGEPCLCCHDIRLALQVVRCETWLRWKHFFMQNDGRTSSWVPLRTSWWCLQHVVPACACVCIQNADCTDSLIHVVPWRKHENKIVLCQGEICRTCTVFAGNRSNSESKLPCGFISEDTFNTSINKWFIM